MSDTKHTPGPWKVTTDGEANFFGIEGKVNEKPNWLFRVQCNGEMQVPEQQENLKLIAAAPEMLEALKDLSLQINEFFTHGEDYRHDALESMKEADEIIKKATV